MMSFTLRCKTTVHATAAEGTTYMLRNTRDVVV